MTDLLERMTLTLAPSPIHGIGVFALRDISQGEKVHAIDFPKAYRVTASELPKDLLERHPYALKTNGVIYPDVFYQAYMNHSSDPNYDATSDRALRDIKQGEEVTESYQQIDEWKEIYPWLIVQA